jgi:integrase
VDPDAQLLLTLDLHLDNGAVGQVILEKLVVRRSYQDEFARAARKAGLPSQFIPHSLRHYLASTALARGIPITDVSQWLGHRSIEVTYRIYRHLMPSAWDRARTALDQAYLEALAGGRPGLGQAPR